MLYEYKSIKNIYSMFEYFYCKTVYVCIRTFCIIFKGYSILLFIIYV